MGNISDHQSIPKVNMLAAAAPRGSSAAALAQAAQPDAAPAAAKRPTISACMIVKDEEERLPTALKSVHPWVDEIIVVDTGSTDRTVEIAKSFGAKVYHHPWEHDFAKHRNQSINYATGDWILIIDADEELDQKTAPILRKMVFAEKEVAGFMFELYNDVTAGGETFLLHARMFRNHIGFRYDGKVHNRPIVPGSMARSGVKLIHYGYNMDPETMAKKHQRRKEMIEKWVREEPDNFQAHSYLAHTYMSDPEAVVKAVDEASLALDLLKKQKGPTRHYPHIYYPLINGLAILQRDEEVIKHSLDCLEISPFYPDPAFFLTGVNYKLQKWGEVRKWAEKFKALQAECKKTPERFVFFENMSYDQQNFVFFRWVVAAAHQNEDAECLEAFECLLNERDAKEAGKRAVQTIMAMGKYQLALDLAGLASKTGPDWEWIQEIKPILEKQIQAEKASEIKEKAQKALESGQHGQAVDLFQQAKDVEPESPDVLFNLAWSLCEDNKLEEAEPWLIKALNAYPGRPWAWRRLGDIAFSRGDYPGAEACYTRYLQHGEADGQVAKRIEVCLRRMTQARPTVSAGPPKLLVFLVGGLAPEMLRQPAPHFLMGTAWGEFIQGSDPPPDAANWATIYTGVGPETHGVTTEATRSRPLGLKDLKTPSLWELLPPEMTIGLVSIPLGSPPLELPGWSLPGFPAGLLEKQMVHPPELTLLALARGYRADYALSHFDDQTARQRLGEDVRQEAFLYQMERNKLKTAMAMPSVDVLVVGLNLLEHMQKAFDLAHHTTFGAYQQAYAIIQSYLDALEPLNYAILSQRGYAHRDSQPKGGGSYCLSWRKGEDSKAEPGDVAPAILGLLGGDLDRLGKPRD